MYSYEDRIRAVKLYLKLGRRLGVTIRQLGCPTKNALRNWHREFDQGLDLPVGYVRRRPKYSADQKKAAVEHFLNHNRCLAGTLKALGYPCRETLASWVYELHPGVRKQVVGKVSGAPRTQVQKQAAVIDLCTRQTSAHEISQKLAVSRPTLYNRKNQLLGREAPASMKHRNEPAPAPEHQELQRQVESLRRDILKLQLEHDILKKANELLKKGLCVGNPP